MAATSRPPNAGFQQISRASSIPNPTASPVSPAPRAAAHLPATSRPQRVPGTSTPHGDSARHHLASTAGNILFCK